MLYETGLSFETPTSHRAEKFYSSLLELVDAYPDLFTESNRPILDAYHEGDYSSRDDDDNDDEDESEFG